MTSKKTRCDNLDQIIREGEITDDFVSALAECMSQDVLRFAQSRCGNRRGDVEDITQDAMVAAQRYLSTFRGEASLRTWLYRLVLSACSRHRRGRKNDPSLHKPIDDEPMEQGAPSGSADPELALLVGEKIGALEEAIAQLKPRDQEMLSDVEWKGQSLAEVAEARGLTVSAVKSRMFRIRQQLREQLQARFSQA